MQEWIIAMLVISVLLILRDMAKTILTGRMSKKEEIFPIGEDHPQKEKVERYAAAFQKLADTFYGMPYKKEYLSSGQIERHQLFQLQLTESLPHRRAAHMKFFC